MIRTLLAAAIATGLAVTAANATVVTNMDKSPAAVTFMPKHGKTLHFTLKPHHHRTIACHTGGTVKLGKSSLACSAKTAKITIKGGKLDI